MRTYTVTNGSRAVTCERDHEVVAVRWVSGFTPSSEFLRSAGLGKEHQIWGEFLLYRSQPSKAAIGAAMRLVRNHPGCIIASHAYREIPSRQLIVPTGHLCISFEVKARRSDIARLLRSHKLVVVDVLDAQTVLAITTKHSSNPLKVAVALEATKSVAACEPDFCVSWQPCSLALPTDPEFPKQWHLRNEGTIEGSRLARLRRGVDVGAVEAWEMLGNLGDPSVLVAVIDAEFNLEHVDIKQSWVNNDLSRRNSYFHGTACAALAIGRANAVGGVGCAPGVSFLPIRVSASASSIAIAEAFAFAVDNGADIISYSFSSPSRIEMFSFAKRKLGEILKQGRSGLGAIAFLPSGNREEDEADGTNPLADNGEVITVAACTSLGAHADYSRSGANIDICAPAGPYYSDPRNPGQPSSQDGHALHAPVELSRRRFGAWNGHTSGATAIAAGAAALVLSAFPNLTFQQLRDVLRSSARTDVIEHAKDADASGYSEKLGFGLINAARAIAELRNG